MIPRPETVRWLPAALRYGTDSPFYPVDEVLEIIAVPLFTQPLHDLDPVAGLLFPVLRKLVDAAFAFAQAMGADKAQVFVIDMYPAAYDLIFDGLEGIAPGHGIFTGFVQYIRKRRNPILFERIW